MQDIDLDLLRCFTTVAEVQNFTEAGARLGRSQSAISVRIRKLEEALGQSLLSRNSRDVQLTEAGRRLMPKAQQMLQASERLMADMRAPVVSGALRIGVVEYLAPHRMPELLQAMERHLPGAELSFRVGLSSGLMQALKDGQIDLALALHDPEADGSLPVGKDPMVWIEGEEAPAQTPEDPLSLCLMQGPCIYRTAAEAALGPARGRARDVLTAGSVAYVRSAVASGLGVTVLGASSLGPGVRINRALMRAYPLPTLALGLHGRDPRRDQVAVVLREVLAQQLPGAR